MHILGYKILNDISWFKPNASPNLFGRHFTTSHETLIWVRKDEKAMHMLTVCLLFEVVVLCIKKTNNKNGNSNRN